MPENADTPDLLALLARVNCHVYSGEMSPQGDYTELFTGPGIAELLGSPLTPDADATQAWHESVHPDDWEIYQSLGLNIGIDETCTVEYRLVGTDSQIRWVLDRMWLRERRSDGTLLVDGVVTDVTALHERTDEARQALDAAQRATAWLEAAVMTSPAALILLDRRARVRLWNPAAERLFGWTEDEVLGQIAPHVPADRLESFLASLEAMVGGESIVEHEEERVDRHGVRRSVNVSAAVIRDVHGEVTGFMGMVTDISERKEMENTLRRLAHSDPLTGLANRVRLIERIDDLVSRERTSGSVALLLLDLDGFKAVNDSFGHAMGDELLLAVAERLGACLRAKDVAARLGGDEFAILIETDSTTEAVQVGERILSSLSQPIELRRAEVVVTASIGIAHAQRDRSTQDLLRDADVAMYMAKDAGKNRLVVFHPSMQERVAARLRLETELRTAVEQRQFEVYYQPLVNLDTRRIVGVEALVRWRHPERGLLLPGAFIGVAEDTGLIVPVGRWILKEACRQAAQWQTGDPAHLLSISVNLSPRQLHDPDLLDVAASALEEAGLPPAALTIEITEDLLLEDTASAVARLAELRALGLRVAVDDFGTGYSSLAYLRRFPVDILKIDRSFVTPLTHGPKPAALVRSIIDLASALDVDTVAEGVEQAEQAITLNELGCHVAQGYYFAVPQPAEAITQLLASASAEIPHQAEDRESVQD